MARTWGGILKWYNGVTWREVFEDDFKVYTDDWKVVDSSHFKIYYPESGDTSVGWYPIRTNKVNLLNGLAAYWKLNDALTGTALNSVSTGNLLALSGAVQGATGLIGSAVQWDSSLSYLSNTTVRPFSGGLPSFSVSLWVYPDVSLSTLGRPWQMIRAGTSPNCFNLMADNVTNQLVGYVYDVSNNYVFQSSQAQVIREKQWNHVCEVWSINANASLYVNNVNVTNYVSQTLTKNVAIPNLSFTLGNGYAGNALGGPGRIDEVAIWNRALNPTEVSALYNSGAGYEIPLFTPVVPEAETTALLARMDTQPSEDLATLINTTIKSLKSTGIWAITDTFHKWDLHTEQASLLDWKNAAHDASVGAGTPLFTPKYGVRTMGLEVATDASRNWIDLNFTPSTDCSYGSLDAIGFSLDDLAGTAITSYNFGAKNAANTSYMFFRTKESDAVPRPWLYLNNIITRVYNGASGIKLFYCERPSSSTIYIWKDPSSSIVGTSNTSVAMIDQKLVLGGYREYNGGINRYGISSSTFWLGGLFTPAQRASWWAIIDYWKANIGSTF